MKVNNPPKLIILILSLICITVLLLFERIDPVAGYGLIGSIVGYAIGNGVAAKEGENVEPVFGTTRRDRRNSDHLPPPEGHPQ